jgi:hypothetical protein
VDETATINHEDNMNTSEETPRQKFLRNHQENIRTMRAALIRAEREGLPDVGAIRGIVQAWEGIGERAEAEESDSA